ncbi:MAG: molybdopterin-dependent oxidoreductase, partial [Acidobacteriaceae bacterium]|nr:molybdopterin-dependent oxidoreductase [Acidobacteriaceae bacterium]
MNKLTRRKLITAGAVAAVAPAGVVAGGNILKRYGLLPPDCGSLYGAGATLTYASQRLLMRHSSAREFSPDQISKEPFANPVGRLGKEFQSLKDGGFADWRLSVDGLVERPASFSLHELKGFPMRSQITHLACEEGWSYIAQWTGVPLSHILSLVGPSSRARYVVYRSFQKGWWDSLDMEDAMHEQTIVAVGMNGGELPVPFGGPLRMRVPRQLVYKSVKFLTSLTVTDDMKSFGKGLGAAAPEA